MTRTIPLLLMILLSLTSCDLIDKAKNEYELIKHKYEEFVGDTDTRGPRPFTVVYQQDENAKSGLISSQCSQNQDVKHIYFSNQTEAHNNIFNAIKNLYSYPYSGILKPFWDIRYTNPVTNYVHHSDRSHYANHAKLTGLDARTGMQNILTGTAASQTDIAGSVVQSKCVDNMLTSGMTLNLNDAPEQALTYAGIASTFTYQVHVDTHTKVWNAQGKGNLMLQGYFDTPIYQNFESNIGGSISYNVFLYNPKINKHLNYVIGIYAAGEAWQKEKAGIRFDPTTNIIHVATVIKADSWWTTISPRSKAITEVFDIPNKTTKDDGQWNNFYRTNISYQNLLAVLNALKSNPPAEVAGQDFGLNPEDWEVILLGVQYELEEQGGKALLSGSFRGFEVYLSQDPL